MSNSIRSEGVETSSVSSDAFPGVLMPERWSALKVKVKALCGFLWPGYGISVSKMAGGDNNHIVKIKLTRGLLGRDIVATYIFRSPKFPFWHPIRPDLAILQYASQLMIPVPRILRADLTTNNPIGAPYSIQTFMPGATLQDLWSTLNLDQKLCIVKDLAQMIRRMDAYPQSMAGTIHPSFFPSSPEEEQASQDPSRPIITGYSYNDQAPRYMIDRNINYWHLSPPVMIPASLRLWEYYRGDPFPWQKVANFAETLTHTGAFAGDTYHFMHGDLFPYNILAQKTSRSTAKITAILDWDQASWAPAVVAYAPPVWMWAWSKYKESDCHPDLQLLVKNQPSRQEDRAIKKAYEKAIGSNILRYAFHEDAHEAHMVYDFAIHGSSDDSHKDVIEEEMAAFHKRHEED